MLITLKMMGTSFVVILVIVKIKEKHIGLIMPKTNAQFVIFTVGACLRVEQWTSSQHLFHVVDFYQFIICRRFIEGYV